ncbi:hypothetical protein [Nocardia pseudovaccinii]|uniref:hypothetical protein n=1 Tax=Nocardia pseudovaccinii TaxID=189540 RepID=UPI0007A3F6A9|nr:hypothetical protein [Nocardia pseudovaccinii]
MKLGTTTLTVAATIAAASVATVPANADPTPEDHYRLEVIGHSVITTLDRGTFSLAPDQQSVVMLDRDGQLLTTLPLTFTLDGEHHQIGQTISDGGRVLALTPDVAALRADGTQPVASPLEEQLALDDLSSNLFRGAIAGTLVGLAVGAVVGGVLGLGSCLLVGPGCLATAPAIILAFAGGGSLVGTLLAGGVGLADGLWKYIITRQAPPGQSPYANQDGLLDPDGTGVPDANLRLPSGSAGALRSGSSSGSGH